jgi:hypothetical protein
MKDDLTGKEFGRWTIIKSVGVIKHNRGTSYLCRCSCKNERVVEGYGLTSGDSTSCGCYHVDSRRKRPFEALYNRLSRTAEKYNHEMLLSYEEFVKFTCEKTCHYCLGAVEWNAYTSLWEPKRLRRAKNSDPLSRTKHTGYNLDRKENSLGYSVENCVVACGWCNRTKGDRFTYEEFMMLVPILRHIQEMRKVTV